MMRRPHRRGVRVMTAQLAMWAAWSLALAAPLHAGEPPVTEDYVLHCSACHGPDGVGVPDRVPSLMATGELALQPGGREYLMRVPGAAQAPLSDERLARLLEWAVERFGGVRIEPPLSAEEVGLARRTPFRDPARARAAVMRGESKLD